MSRLVRSLAADTARSTKGFAGKSNLAEVPPDFGRVPAKVIESLSERCS